MNVWLASGRRLGIWLPQVSPASEREPGRDDRLGPLSLDGIRKSVAHGGIDVALDHARGRDRFEPLARLSLSTLVDAQANDVSFDPVLNTAPGLALYPGWLADLRARAYQRSREGRDAA